MPRRMKRMRQDEPTLVDLLGLENAPTIGGGSVVDDDELVTFPLAGDLVDERHHDEAWDEPWPDLTAAREDDDPRAVAAIRKALAPPLADALDLEQVRTCAGCGQEKPMACYGRYGRGWYRLCLDCRPEVNRERVAIEEPLGYSHLTQRYRVSTATDEANERVHQRRRAERVQRSSLLPPLAPDGRHDLLRILRDGFQRMLDEMAAALGVVPVESDG